MSIGEMGNVFCRFGINIVVGTVIAKNEIYCVSPMAEASARVGIFIAFGKSDFIPLNATFEYGDDFYVHSISPILGPKYGGTNVSITGAGFECHPKCYCKFGSVQIEAGLLNSSMLRCKSPEAVGDQNDVPVLVSLNGADFVGAPDLFAYYETPSVTSIFPYNGPETGNTRIKVLGSNFKDTKGLLCQFGRFSAATRGIFVNSRYIECLSPSHNPGIVSLSISNNGMDFSPSTAEYEFYGRVFIYSISPLQGTVAGGTTVKIRGSGFIFSSLLRCKFGDREVGASFIDSENIRCISPQHLNGSVILSVTNNGYNFESFENVFTYINSPILSMVVPSFVTEGAATSLHIHGKSLTNQSICIFYMNDRDSMPLKTNATIISPNLARCASVEELSLGIYSLRIAALDDSFRSLNVLSFEVKKIFFITPNNTSFWAV